MWTRTVCGVGLTVAVLSIAACHTLAQSVAVPALLAPPSTACQQQLESAIANRLGAPVTLGDSAFRTSSELLLDHRPARDPLGVLKDGNLTGRPASFHLLKLGEQCLLQHQQQGERTALPACSCQARP